METANRSRSLHAVLLGFALAVLLPSIAAAQAGVITGRVTDESGGAPLEAARVVLSGTALIQTTNREGQYTFRGVSPGAYQLRVLRVGYRPATQTATVAEGETATLDFAMTAAPVQLDEIVSTATGEQRKLEIGNSVTTIDAAKVAEQAPITVCRNLHKARAGAEVAAEALQKYLVDPTASPDVPEMQSIAGFTYLYFGEDFCSGVPFSRVRGDTITFGMPLTTGDVYTVALAKFDSALAHPGLGADEDGSITNLALVGRGRALLDLGQYAEAASAVAAVPTDFKYETEHADSPLRLQNAVWAYTNGGLWSVSDAEGGNGLPYISALDPRVQVDSVDSDGDGFADPGLDLITPQYSLLKYPAATSPIPVADGIEARLIEAEAQLQASNFSGMNATLNNLRQTAISPALPNLPNPANRDAAIDRLFSERAFWLYATGHRLGDMRRLIKVYGRNSETVFPTGAYHKNGTYGPDVNLPIPIEEQNNPNSKGCLDRNA